MADIRNDGSVSLGTGTAGGGVPARASSTPAASATPSRAAIRERRRCTDPRL